MTETEWTGPSLREVANTLRTKSTPLSALIPQLQRAADKIDAQAAEIEALRRWKSTNAPRLEALQVLLDHERAEAAKGQEARGSLESERAANAILTAEIEAMKADAERLDSRCIALTENDEFGDEFKRIIVGIDLRAAIDAARKVTP